MPELRIPRKWVNIPVICAFCGATVEAGLQGTDEQGNEDPAIIVRPCPGCLKKERKGFELNKEMFEVLKEVKEALLKNQVMICKMGGKSQCGEMLEKISGIIQRVKV